MLTEKTWLRFQEKPCDILQIGHAVFTFRILGADTMSQLKNALNMVFASP